MELNGVELNIIEMEMEMVQCGTRVGVLYSSVPILSALWCMESDMVHYGWYCHKL